MKFIFIVNPKAGNYSALGTVVGGLNDLNQKIDYEIYVTRCPGDATVFVKEYMRKNGDYETCFVSCGGDGTLNEVGNGVVGYDKACLACLPCGSGNDFIKYYGEQTALQDVGRIVNGTTHRIDALRVNGKYCFNVCHFGLDSVVAATANRIKLKDGKHPYERGVVAGVFKGMNNKIKVVADGAELTKKSMLLCELGNGRYVGGKYKCAPHALNDDGLIDVLVVHHTNIFIFLSMLKSYTNGTLLDDPRRAKVGTAVRARHIEVSSAAHFEISVDGEMMGGNEFTVDIVPGALRFMVPDTNGL